ncbi:MULTISPECIES: dinucleotide-binding protein [Streptomyces]|uniref:Dinucleotide-binding protein n=1 Tax=Streptomyces tsukubensis (strain DSM 42081 / NBRC 108919 / NRRL 18488 / 9993) TaxID=1114943 RepID=I2NAQ2_STRT9|nr:MULTISPECIES: dinucleotide-binding protein [Streptomyces]AZK97877.1 dinucleotide-binding protein [Streptomyces tsukubensis]EIF94099.1 NADP oxidoreductase, coenzyme f420-dependent:6-phosphogluconate dehydrogenase, NAD-binding protein [Streptomyces tsukubensis NRRL18488]MYS67253.1 dinucleotide-binding protein [Streptomyces sp. SID5473]QKM66194.1 dinucleotide-binding protein [Streptomyces tsukubensis NRRL18488]TAI45468.1 dinucleotide-binding protein [Streptomyces tsukubensis]
MNITVIGRGRVGGGLARLWTRAGHVVTGLGRDGGDATGADVVVVAVPGQAIAEALGRVSGLSGRTTIDTTNLYEERNSSFPSLSHHIKSIVGGPTAKAFSTVFATTYERIPAQRIRPGNLFASEPAARGTTEQLIRDAGFDPVFVGDLTPGARLLEDSSGLTRALAGQMGPFFYRYGRPGEF